jgi:hypothetical protein
MLKELRYMIFTFLKCIAVIGIIVLAIMAYMQFIKKDPKIISNKKVILNVQKKIDAYLKIHSYVGFTKNKSNNTIYDLLPGLKGVKYKSGNPLIDPEYTILPTYNTAEDASYICAIKLLDDPKTQYVNEADYCIYVKKPNYTMSIVDDTVQIGIDGYVKNKDVLSGKYIKYGLIKKDGLS